MHGRNESQWTCISHHCIPQLVVLHSTICQVPNDGSLQQCDIFHMYNTRGFRITVICCDNEFQPFIDPLAQEFNIAMNFANLQENVPEAKRNNRVIEERVKALYHYLP